MRKYLTIVILLCLCQFLYGQNLNEIDPSKFPQPTQAAGIRLWFDDNIGTLLTTEQTSGQIHLNTTILSDGVHVLHCQIVDNKGIVSPPQSSIFVKIPKVKQTDKIIPTKLVYWIDDETTIKTIDITSEDLILDVSYLQNGLHTLHCFVTCNDGSVTSASSGLFMRMNVDLGVLSTAKSFRYWFDDINDVKEVDVINETQILDIKGLDSGLHTIHYQIIDDREILSSPVSRLFVKFPENKYANEENVITQYRYWLNDNTTEIHKETIYNPTSPYQLISLLPVQKEPIRSSCFHFEAKEGIPMIYAKNDLHIRFEDAVGYWTDASRSFIDYNAGEVVTITKQLNEIFGSESFAVPTNNTIKWYSIECQNGDSIAVQSTLATSIQIFSPTGEEVYNVYGSESVKMRGLHTREDGTYYLAIHDVTGSKSEMTLNYQHIDRYTILDQDVHVVGNGGCSTITYAGNGFKDLYAVDLVNGNGCIINHIDIGHENNASTTVTFDFTGLELDKYNAIFHFTEEDRILPNNITVEEAKEIELETKVSFPTTFIRGSSVTYTVEITNKGNMTAYKTPIYIYIGSESESGVSRIKIRGLDLPGIYDGIEKDNIDEQNKKWLQDSQDKIGDNHYFIGSKVWDKDVNDSIYARAAYFFTNIAPDTTLVINIDIMSTESVKVKVTIPKYNFAISTQADRATAKLNTANRASLLESYCCIRDKVECVVNLFADFAGLVSEVLPPGSPHSVVANVIDCLAAGASKMLSAMGEVLCDEENKEKDFLQACREITDGVSSVLTIISCASNILPWNILESIVKHTNQYNGVYGFSTDIVDCIDAFLVEKPVCPLNSVTEGGSSNAVASRDPNDIYGYIASSGSKYVAEDIVTLPYRIEFENDSTFATAPAHTVIVKDTLDAKLFDLNSYKPTSVKIGDKLEYLNGAPNFVKTIDMRPAINTIAQIEGKYDAQEGIAIWVFTSLDPMTMEPTDDVMQGFLPVNYDGVSGIGEILFDINRKKGLVDGTEIFNKASIVFDNNDPILTPTWTNIIDAVPPTSITTDVTLKDDSTATIYFEGEDERSGLWKYKVYAQVGPNAPWWEITECSADSISVDYQIIKDIDYGFCVLAVDSAGNLEKKNFEREASLCLYSPSTKTLTALEDPDNVGDFYTSFYTSEYNLNSATL